MRILEVELARGENPTAASQPARALLSVFGLDRLMSFLAALGNRPFAKDHRALGRAEVFTHLIDFTFPTPDDTLGAFTARMKEAKIPVQRLVQLGFLAPQWLAHVEHALGWAGYREAVWWFFADARDQQRRCLGERRVRRTGIQPRHRLAETAPRQDAVDPRGAPGGNAGRRVVPSSL